MEQAIPTRPISDLRQHHNEVLLAMAQKPVMLAQNGEPRAVLIKIEHWNKLFQLLEDKDDIIDVLEAELALATGEDERIEDNGEFLNELKAMVQGNAVPA